MIRDAEGLAVQTVGIFFSLDIVFQLDPSVRIGSVVVCGKTVTVVSALHIPVVTAVPCEAESVRRVRELAGCKLSPLISLIGQTQTVAVLTDIKPVSVIIQAVNFILVRADLFKIV